MALATRILAGAATALALTACSGADTDAPSETAAINPECVPIADGTYEIRGGKVLVMAPGSSQPQPAPVSGTLEEPVGWAAKLEAGFGDRGYAWMGLKVRDGVAALTGTAPGEAARDVSFVAGKATIEGDAEGAGKVRLVVNAMGIEGREEDSAGAALAALMGGDVTLDDCQRAFDRAMQAHDISFPVNTAYISAAETPAVDAATGIAMLCSAYKIEIGEHTDSRGSDSYNMQLSRQRADALKAYMVEKGVDENVLTAAGYGESRPIDPANTAEAWAKNERTEFRVSAK